MIELFDGYRIVPDDYSYKLVKYAGDKVYADGKTRKVQKVIGYFPSVESALKSLAKELAREKVSASVGGLTEAIGAIVESNRRVEKYIESEIGKYEQQSKGEES